MPAVERRGTHGVPSSARLLRGAAAGSREMAVILSAEDTQQMSPQHTGLSQLSLVVCVKSKNKEKSKDEKQSP